MHHTTCQIAGLVKEQGSGRGAGDTDAGDSMRVIAGAVLINVAAHGGQGCVCTITVGQHHP